MSSVKLSCQTAVVVVLDDVSMSSLEALRLSHVRSDILLIDSQLTFSVDRFSYTVYDSV